MKHSFALMKKIKEVVLVIIGLFGLSSFLQNLLFLRDAVEWVSSKISGIIPYFVYLFDRIDIIIIYYRLIAYGILDVFHIPIPYILCDITAIFFLSRFIAKWISKIIFRNEDLGFFVAKLDSIERSVDKYFISNGVDIKKIKHSFNNTKLAGLIFLFRTHLLIRNEINTFNKFKYSSIIQKYRMMLFTETFKQISTSEWILFFPILNKIFASAIIHVIIVIFIYSLYEFDILYVNIIRSYLTKS